MQGTSEIMPLANPKQTNDLDSMRISYVPPTFQQQNATIQRNAFAPSAEPIHASVEAKSMEVAFNSTGNPTALEAGVPAPERTSWMPKLPNIKDFVTTDKPNLYVSDGQDPNQPPRKPTQDDTDNPDYVNKVTNASYQNPDYKKKRNALRSFLI